MFKRKLTALKYFKDDVNINDENEFRNLIVFVEDQKIRHYRIEDREHLRDVKSNKWNDAFTQYLNDLECPITETEEKALILDWILGLAVRLQYEDEGMDKKIEENDNNVPKMVMSNPFDKFDFNDIEFINGINNLATLLKIPKHPDHLITLKAIAILLSKQLEEHTKATKTPKNLIKFDDIKMNSHKDEVINRCIKVLRLLHINELRDIQTKINDIIVAVQSVTANPKTDTTLGKVGRI